MANKSSALREVNKGLQGNEMSGPNTFNQFQVGAMTNLQQWTSRFNVADKQNGSYVRSSVKESSSSGDVFKERGSGRVGFKDEQKVTTTVKISDKSGYSEYQVEERFRNVSFGDGNKNTPAEGINESDDDSNADDDSNDEGSHEVTDDDSNDGVADSWDSYCDHSDDYDDDYSNDHSSYDDDDDDDDYY